MQGGRYVHKTRLTPNPDTFCNVNNHISHTRYLIYNIASSYFISYEWPRRIGGFARFVFAIRFNFA